MPRTAISQADAAEIVLRETGRPMHRTEITDEILRRGLDVWSEGSPGRTPWESVGRAITQEIVQLGEASRFDYERKGAGTYRLRKTGEATAGERRPQNASTNAIVLELDDDTLTWLDAECCIRSLSREELAGRLLKKRLWEIDNKRAEEEWERSYRENPPQDGELEPWDSVRSSPGPWNPRAAS